MGKYYTDSKAFNGYIMAEFKFDIFDVFSQHFKVHNSVILSFKPNEIVIQTMRDNMDETKDDSDIKGFYTTTIPIGSLEKYDFECNINEVNVIVTNSLLTLNRPGGGGGGIRPQAGSFLCCAETVSSRKLKLSDFYYILIGLNSEYKAVPWDIHCCHGNAIVEGCSVKF